MVVLSLIAKFMFFKDIINLVEDIRILSIFFRDIRIKYYNRSITGDSDAKTKNPHQ